MTEEELKEKAQAHVEELEKELTSTIGRKVALAVGLLAPVIAVACAWLQEKFGVNLNPGAVTALVSGTVVGVTGAGATWLYNRGGFEQRAEQFYTLYMHGREIEGLPPE